jgi:hypothetical protein
MDRLEEELSMDIILWGSNASDFRWSLRGVAMTLIDNTASELSRRFFSQKIKNRPVSFESWYIQNVVLA